jgi:predicted nucleic acid-binding protein
MSVLYIETSIVSYLRLRPSKQVVCAARQMLSKRWWETERQNYELVTSQYVLDEAARGNQALAAKRLQALENIPLLDLPPDVARIANELLLQAALPGNARLDALHIAVAAFHEVDYLLTWNCSHIANARILPRVREVLSGLGFSTPIICTPEEMVDDSE